ncbi:hypothetical protein AB0I98_27875 [Streptomyces sp. NPDC050211]|uniref:hypothetical protein n=1 Tax=Streptomyces sp. NPDC050211 TaxID=3154932 RepID=UPI0034296C0F
MPVPDKVPGRRATVTDRTGLFIELQWDGQRERTGLLEVRDLADGRRAVLTIVNAHHHPPVPSRRIRMVWVYWDPENMQLINRWHGAALATAEAEWHEGDTHRIRAGEMSDCFKGDWTTFRPRRGIEVRAGGRWRRAELWCRFNGPTKDRAVMDAWVPFYEPEWGAAVTYRRMYRWDPHAIRLSHGRQGGARSTDV